MRTHTDRDIRMLVAKSSVGAHHVPLDLRGANLELANLPSIDLRGANLAGANLRGAVLWGAQLIGACLDGADFTCASMSDCIVQGCSLQGTLFIEADLTEGMVGFEFMDAIAPGANLSTILYSLSKNGERRLKNPPAGPLREVKAATEQALLAAHIKNASPALRQRGAVGRGKGIDESSALARVLSDADIQELLRWSAKAGKPLNLRGCNLSGANLCNASLNGACLVHADLTGADITNASFVDANLNRVRGLRAQPPGC